MSARLAASYSYSHRLRNSLIIALALSAFSLAPHLGEMTQALLDEYMPSARVNGALPLWSVARENTKGGSTGWELTPGAATTYLQGYAGTVSAAPGAVVPLYVSAPARVRYDLTVYRLGWYHGLGGRLYFTARNLLVTPQGYWTPASGLVDCHSCQIDPATHRVDANWSASYQLRLGTDWPGGAYLIKLSAGNWAQAYIPLVVRSDTAQTTAQTPLLVSLPVNTYQAYNAWGGYSLYGQTGQRDYSLRATNVSFNRPYDRSAGAGDLLAWDIHAIRWIERQGYDAGYTTTVDVAEHPEQLLAHRVVVSVGHDEYWTKTMRDGFEAARDAGVNLAFLGANDAYWQARLAPDAVGHPDRTLVCYKVQTGQSDPSTQLTRDPEYPAHPELVTTEWRDPVLHRPENSLLGLMYSSFFVGDGRYLPEWEATTTPDAWLAGAGIRPGQHIPGGLLGYEYDRRSDNGATPANLVVLAESSLMNYRGEHDHADTAYYRAASGALVFDAGSIWWGYGLDSLSAPGAYQPNYLRGNAAIYKLTAFIFETMLANPPLQSAPVPTPAPPLTPTPTL